MARQVGVRPILIVIVLVIGAFYAVEAIKNHSSGHSAASTTSTSVQNPPTQTVAATSSPSSSIHVTALPACSPAPCADYQGLTMRATVNRNYTSAAGGLHVVRVVMNFTDSTGEHSPGAGASFGLRDSLGSWHDVLDHQVGRLSDPTCGDPSTLATVTLGPGGKYGPIALCFQAAGSTIDPVMLAWGADGLGCAVDIDIPSTVQAAPTGVSLVVDAPDVVRYW